MKKDAPLTRSEQGCWFYTERVSVLPFLSSAVSAALQQQRNEPPQWGDTGEGYGKRFGSSLAAGALQDTAQLITGMALNEDQRFITLGKGAFAKRFGHAVFVSPLIARNARGHRELAIGRLAGATAGGFIPNVWYPTGRNSGSDGAQRALISFAGYAVGSLLAEFQPFQHIFHHGK